jgi:hypothetical protein
LTVTHRWAMIAGDHDRQELEMARAKIAAGV